MNICAVSPDVVAGAGYHERVRFQACEQAGLTTCVSAPAAASGRSTDGQAVYPKEKFTYGAAQDADVCPAGQTLPHAGAGRKHGKDCAYDQNPRPARPARNERSARARPATNSRAWKTKRWPNARRNAWRGNPGWWLGARALAANEITRQLVMLALTVPMGLLGAIAIRVGHAAGRAEAREFRAAVPASLVTVGGAVAATGAAIFFGRRELAQLFPGEDGGVRVEVLATAEWVPGVATGWVTADGVVLGCFGVFRGMAAVRAPAAICAAGLWLVASVTGGRLCIALEYTLPSKGRTVCSPSV